MWEFPKQQAPFPPETLYYMTSCHVFKVQFGVRSSKASRLGFGEGARHAPPPPSLFPPPSSPDGHDSRKRFHFHP